ncbi:hypothetical protein A8E05_35460 [Burkholderia cenocepacia]|nr:hypothetical protein A8E05_35460 [Burkholderia cenocepacia]ONQ95252.1 hypothetical protein A8E04_23490 [Burkholderia cenocepacia]ONQ98196.1 hypothetical protein A8E10_36380 [Burkholderia cenocepacia]ONR06922.1 hypothetical protein A8E10_18720 [Burkholderia cenocepacia]ONR11295.1 hypothetical protein A8E14_24290 [Burkholderia cenocepacia]
MKQPAADTGVSICHVVSGSMKEARPERAHAMKQVAPILKGGRCAPNQRCSISKASVFIRETLINSAWRSSLTRPRAL